MASKKQIKAPLLYIAAVLLCAATFSLVHSSTASSEVFEGVWYVSSFGHYSENDQYALLADAILDGRVTLDLPVSNALAALSNPYDCGARIAVSDDGAQPIYWDHAFYQGKYYCYFGVVPALLLYVPFQALTGSWLSTPVAIEVLGLLFIVCAALLVRRVARRYFPTEVSESMQAIALLVLVGGSNVMYLGFVSRFYSVPLLTSMSLTALGLWFWMGARRDLLGSTSGGVARLSGFHLAAGSVCMALNFGSRPQFVLACFLAFPLFWEEIVRDRLLFSRKGLACTVAALLPALMVIAPLMWYNYVRFGNILDFGSNYNLTGFDMPNYQQSLRLTPLLLYFYLFQPPSFSLEFPYVNTTDLSYSDGWAPTEPMFGGYFWLVPMVLLLLLIPVARKELERRRLWGIMLAMLAFAAGVLVTDTRHAGVTQRYFGDFGMYAMLASVFVLFSLVAREKAGESRSSACGKALRAFVGLSLAWCVVIGGLSFLSPDRYDSIAKMNPDLYEQIVGAVSS